MDELMHGQTEGQKDGLSNGRAHPLIEMRKIENHKSHGRNQFYLSVLNALRYGEKEQAETIKASASKWLRNVTSLGDVVTSPGDAGLQGFKRQRHTPYVHITGTHGWKFVSQVGPLGKFSGEKLEALNDSFKREHFRQTNGRNLRQSILIQKRFEHAKRGQAVRMHRKHAGKAPKLGCQVCEYVRALSFA